MERTVFEIIKVNSYGEQIDRIDKEFSTYEEAEKYFNTPWLIPNKGKGYEIVETTYRTISVGDRF